MISVATLVPASLLPPGARAQSGAFLAPPGKGIVRALVVGIDRYDNVRDLKGATADARDLETTLRQLGVGDLTVLIDKAASRRAVQAAMERLQTAARAGDLVILTLAGHGAREPERVKGSNADGYDKSFLFSGFNQSGAGTAERILSNEIKAWIYRLERQGVDTLFVADTCHGGGLIRSVDPRAGELSYRSAGEITLLEDELKPVSTAADAFRDEADFNRLTFLAAADKESKVPEVSIPGIPGLRGALSFSVARALQGAVTGDQNGIVTRRRLFEYSQQIVYQYSQTRQAIWVEPTSTRPKLDGAVFRTNAAAAPLPPIPAGSEAKPASIRVRVVNAAGNSLAGVGPLQVPFQIVGPSEPADLIWDAGRREVVSASGDIIATEIAPGDLPGVVDRTSAVMTIAKLAESRPQSIAVRPNDARHHAGERVRIQLDAAAGKFVILFNVTGDGTVQYLFPKPNDNPRPQDAGFDLPLTVQSPFGVDHVVAIVSDARLSEMEQALQRLNGRRAAGLLPAILQPLQSADRSVRMGTAGLFTAP
jgi:hypothetical protein